jgi:hypothetical protein
MGPVGHPDDPIVPTWHAGNLGTMGVHHAGDQLGRGARKDACGDGRAQDLHNTLIGLRQHGVDPSTLDGTRTLWVSAEGASGVGPHGPL